MQIAAAGLQSRKSSGDLNSHAFNQSWLNARIFWTLSSIKSILFRKFYYMLMNIENMLAQFQYCLIKKLINFMCYKNNKF